MSTLDLMSWIIGIANPLSALLVGTTLALLLTAHPRLALWCSGLGWLVLLIAQVTFLAFGFESGFPGFKYGQPAMIPIAAANFVAWILLRRRARRPSPIHEYEYAVAWPIQQRSSHTDWVTDEARARADWAALSQAHPDARLLRRRVAVIGTIEQESRPVAEPSKLG